MNEFLPRREMLEGATDLELSTALDDANIPTLIAVLAQITGDSAYLEGSELPSSNDTDGTKNISDAKISAIRADAFKVLSDVRDGLRDIPALPGLEVMQGIASVCAGEPVAGEYIPMVLEDMGFVGPATQRVQWTDKQPESAKNEEFKVLIIGAGISGLCAAIHLDQIGIPYTIVEKNPELGGTWYENDYPACGVDTPNHFYSFSFEPNNNWSSFYSKQGEILKYLKDIAAKYDVYKNIQFNTSVESATYNEKTKQWQVETISSQSGSEQLNANAVLSGVGQVSRPTVPEFDGKQDFGGHSFHSSQWNHDVNLAGARVAVVGTGASAMQFAPEIASEVESLTIFQRTPHWIRMMPDYHRDVSEGKRWLLSHVPFYRNWYRFRLYWGYGDEVLKTLHVDPEWTNKEQSINAENQRHREIYTYRLSKALDYDEELMKKVIPDYPLFGKRMLIDNNWCQMLKRDNVDLVCSGVGKITEQGIVDDDGLEREFDVIIYATGFKTLEFLWPMKISGRKGKVLSEQWGEDPRAYLGMSVPDFPNLFMFYGPNTNLAHGGSIIFHAECQARYIAQTLARLLENGNSEVEVLPEVYEEYNRKVQAEHAKLIWINSGVDNWSKNASGRVVCVTPWRLVDYWNMTYQPDMNDYEQA